MGQILSWYALSHPCRGDVLVVARAEPCTEFLLALWTELLASGEGRAVNFKV